MCQFLYWPLSWICHSRAIEHRINKNHEMTLQLIHPNQNQLTFKVLLGKNNTVSIHQRNLQTFATKIYKAKSKISPEILNSLSLRNFTVHFGNESLSPLALKVWVLVPNSVREETIINFQN